jgi:hypothetical protein
MLLAATSSSSSSNLATRFRRRSAATPCTGTTRRTTGLTGCPFGDDEGIPDEDVGWDPNCNQIPQVYGWTCSSCSLEWVKRAIALISPQDIYASRYATVYEIGYPDNINPSYGLMDASGTALRAVLDSYGVPTSQAWLDFDTVYAMAQETTGMMSGAVYYHWVALRGISGPDLWIANSAPGYKGVWDVLTRADFERLGAFSVVLLT